MDMHPVKCGYCGATVAFSDEPCVLKNKIACSSWCRGEDPVAQNERRRDTFHFMRGFLGISPYNIGKLFGGIAHATVYRVTDKGIR